MKNRFFIVLFTGLFVFPGATDAETVVGGIINKDTRWTAEEGPYVVTQDIMVSKSAHLAIGPGTAILIGKERVRNKAVPQLDALDSGTISIVVQGGFECVGIADKRISFMPEGAKGAGPRWYGIVFKNAPEKGVEFGYADISGAYNAISVLNCSPNVHHCRIDYNNVGIVCQQRGNITAINNVIASNYTFGIKSSQSNPVFQNNIIAFNKSNGLWCDGTSAITFEYNCVYGNSDGNLLDCDPELGILKKKNDRKDSTDIKNNLFKNPIFAGSEFDSVAVERDVSLPTDKSRIKDTVLAKSLHTELSDSTASKKRKKTSDRYTLSRYSPCIHAGNPSGEFKNGDNSRNDMGMYGGSKFAPKRD